MAESIIKLGHKGIVYEDCEEFRDSIFETVYNEAKEYVEQIIKDNIQLEQSENHGNDFRNKEQVDNIIAFIGRRGTGKTSAMLSFMEGLKDHNKNGKKILDKDQNGEYRFIGIEWIEASLLEKNEDIFETILIKMFGEFQEKARDIYGRGRGSLDQKNKDLCQKFENVYKRILQLKNKDSVYQTDSVLTALRDLSRGNTVREEFASLIRAYVSFMNAINERERENKRTYLVVAIDDIDINYEKGYEVLEQIHRYLMVPGLIVLVAINFEEMLLCCQKQYADAYLHLTTVNRTVEFEKRAKQMSEEYLEKVLPPYRRVYLPSLKKRDYFIGSGKKVKIGETKYDSIKEGIFKLVWRQTGVYYDANGEKRHFMEPVTLRNLTTNFELYHKMTELPELGTEDYLRIYDENYYKVLNDILFRFALEGLPEREYRLLMRWNEEKILRRGEEIVEDVVSIVKYLAGKQQGFEKIAEDYKTVKYCYGELLRCIYLMGRMWDYNGRKGRKRFYDKKLVHVLLEQYTVTLSWIYEHYLLERGDKKKEYEDMLKKLLDGSVVGSWGKEIGPKVGSAVVVKRGNSDNGSNDQGQSEDNCFAAVQGIHLKDFYFYKWNKEHAINTLCNEWSWDKCVELMSGDDFSGIIITMFFLRNIVDCPSGLNGKYSFTIRCAEEGAEEEGSRISLKEGLADYDIFNFVNNSFSYEETLKEIYIAFAEALFDVSNDLSNDIKKSERQSIPANVEDFLTEQEKCSKSLIRQFREWEKEKDSLALPVYNLDIMYNLIKRLATKYDFGIKEDRIRPDEAYQVIKKTLEKIGEELKRQDEFYEGCESHFADHFKKCPIVRLVCSDKNKKYESSFLCFFENSHEQSHIAAAAANASDTES